MSDKKLFSDEQLKELRNMSMNYGSSEERGLILLGILLNRGMIRLAEAIEKVAESNDNK